MKRVALLLLIAAFLAACTIPLDILQPTETTTPQVIIITQAVVVTATPIPPAAATEPPAPPATEAPPPVVEGTPLNLGGVNMVIPACLPVTASGNLIPAQVYDPMGGPQEVFPQHRRINFSGYPLSGTFFPPYMRVFPVADFAAAYAAAPENYAAHTIAAMQALLAARPPDSDASLPFLVMAGAGQVFHTQAEYLDFANGSGVRYLTSYGQYYVPYNNHELFYTFQGLTSDGKYWVSVVFPINHPVLPPNAESTVVPPGGIAIPSYSSPTFDTDMAAYYAAMKGLMNAQADNSFIPGLDCLDAYIRSLNIGD